MSLEFGKRFWKFASRAASLIAILGAGYSAFEYFTEKGYVNLNPTARAVTRAPPHVAPVPPIPPTPAPVTPAPAPIPLPRLEDLIPPAQAVATVVRAYNPNPYTSDYLAEYSVTNNAVGSVKDVEVSLWALEGQRPIKIYSRSVGYIGQGDANVASAIRSPILRGKFLLCISYRYGQHHVERLDFFSDEGQPDIALYHGYPKFRDAIVNLDGAGHLCREVPTSIQTWLR